MKIALVTPCSRPENLISMYDSINFPCDWHIVFDADDNGFARIMDRFRDNLFLFDWIKPLAVKGGVSGNMQRNLALDNITDGWCYFLDDDNLMHPMWYEVTTGILRGRNDISGIFYSQKVGSKTRVVSPDTIRVGFVDQAQWLVKRDLIGTHRFEQVYYADGIMAETLYDSCKKGFVFYNDSDVTIYNAINDGRKVKTNRSTK